jgi:hypothetical protein
MPSPQALSKFMTNRHLPITLAIDDFSKSDLQDWISYNLTSTFLLAVSAARGGFKLNRAYTGSVRVRAGALCIAYQYFVR